MARRKEKYLEVYEIGRPQSEQGGTDTYYIKDDGKRNLSVWMNGGKIADGFLTIHDARICVFETAREEIATEIQKACKAVKRGEALIERLSDVWHLSKFQKMEDE